MRFLPGLLAAVSTVVIADVAVAQMTLPHVPYLVHEKLGDGWRPEPTVAYIKDEVGGAFARHGPFGLNMSAHTIPSRYDFWSMSHGEPLQPSGYKELVAYSEHFGSTGTIMVWDMSSGSVTQEPCSRSGNDNFPSIHEKLIAWQEGPDKIVYTEPGSGQCNYVPNYGSRPSVYNEMIAYETPAGAIEMYDGANVHVVYNSPYARAARPNIVEDTIAYEVDYGWSSTIQFGPIHSPYSATLPTLAFCTHARDPKIAQTGRKTTIVFRGENCTLNGMLYPDVMMAAAVDASGTRMYKVAAGGVTRANRSDASAHDVRGADAVWSEGSAFIIYMKLDLNAM